MVEAVAFPVWAYEVAPGEVALLTKAEVERRGLPSASDSWKDAPDEWTDAISSAHPTRSGSHDEYRVAMKMVGHRHSKGELVELVNWLLMVCTAARRYHSSNDDGHACPRDGSECDGCVLQDALATLKPT